MRFLIEQIPWGMVGSCVLSVLLAVILIRRIRPGSRDGAIALALSAAILTLQAALYFRSTVDDAFITFRFARNWAEGLGPVYQAGERVEGYTSFAWMALLALAHRVGIDIENASKVLGYGSALAGLFFTLRLSRSALEDRALAPLGPLLLALQPLWAAWTFAGMEAVFFAAALAGAAGLMVGESDAGRRPLWSAVAFGLLIWIRPEGALFAGCAWLALYPLGDLRAGGWRNAVRWALLFGAVAAPFWLWRWSYYGALFPNTLYAKTELSLGSLYRGIASLGDFGLYWGALALILIVLSLLSGRPPGALGRFLRLAVPLFLLYTVWAGGDVLHLRFFVHVLPLLVVMMLPGLENAVRLLRPVGEAASARARAVAAISAVGGFVVLAYLADARAFVTADQFGPSYVVANARNVMQADAPLGRWLHDHAAPGSRVAAWDIGALGYYSQLPIVDLFGLTDRTFAQLIHHRATPLQLLNALRASPPDYIVDYGANGVIRSNWLDSDPAWLRSHYKITSYWPDSPYTGVVLLTRVYARPSR